MAITGDIEEFSLPEIFNFLENQQGTGLLSIYSPAGSCVQQGKVNYVWLRQGRIVAVADRLDGLGLVSMISHRGWIGHREICELLKPCPSTAVTPTGFLLKDKEVMTAEQLQLLFYVQVLRPVCSLFKLQSGYFVFDTMAACPWQEMTGLSLSATLATLLGLRVLRDWTSLAKKLPAPTSILSKAGSGKPHLKLDSQEWQVWEFVDAKRSVQAIAEQLNLSLKTVQQIAYRLSMVGLVEDVSIITLNANISNGCTLPECQSKSQATGLLEASAAWPKNKRQFQNAKGRRAESHRGKGAIGIQVLLGHSPSSPVP